MARSRDGLIFILEVTMDILLKNCFIDVVLKHSDSWKHMLGTLGIFMYIEQNPLCVTVMMKDMNTYGVKSGI